MTHSRERSGYAHRVARRTNDSVPETADATGITNRNAGVVRFLQLQGAWPDALTEASRACEHARARQSQAAGRGPLSTGRDPPSARRVCESGGRLSLRERAGMRAPARPRAAPAGARTHRRRVCGDTPADERDRRSVATRPTLAGIPGDHARDRRSRGGPTRPRRATGAGARHSTPTSCARSWCRPMVRSPSPKAMRMLRSSRFGRAFELWERLEAPRRGGARARTHRASLSCPQRR